jgi:hypothetical protein
VTFKEAAQRSVNSIFSRLGEDATFTAAGGQPLAVRAVRRQPDEIIDVASSRIHTEINILLLRVETIHIEPDNLRLLIRTIRQHPVRREWQPTVYQREGDLALLRQSRHPVHVGVWLDVDGGGVLHCLRGCGVVFQTLASLRLSGWQIESFYTYIGDLNHDRAHEQHSHPSPQPVSAGTQP